MPRLKLPESAARTLLQLAQYPAEFLQDLMAALARVPLQAYPAEALEKAAAKVLPAGGPSGSDVADLVRGLHVTRYHAQVGTESEYVALLVDVALATNVTGLASKPTPKSVEATIVNLLGLQRVALSTKANDLALDQERYLTAVRILSDARPVFDEAGTTVEAFVVSHSLKLSYTSGRERSAFYVALDDADLELLEASIDRAQQKSAAIKELAKKLQIPTIEGPVE